MWHLSLSLIHGWLPAAVQAITAVVLVGAIGWRSRRWRVLWLPVLVAVPLCVLCAALTINLWVGSLPHRGQRLNQLTGGPLPDQANRVPRP